MNSKGALLTHEVEIEIPFHDCYTYMDVVNKYHRQINYDHFHLEFAAM